MMSVSWDVIMSLTFKMVIMLPTCVRDPDDKNTIIISPSNHQEQIACQSIISNTMEILSKML